MKIKYLTVIAAIAAAVAAQATFAQGKKYECYDEASMPKAKSDSSRVAVKGQITGKEYTCFDEAATPKAKSSKDRAAVKAEAKAAMKAGEIPQGEANLPAKK
jgi:hypothetical protein